jgi:hypothetical protein
MSQIPALQPSGGGGGEPEDAQQEAAVGPSSPVAAPPPQQQQHRAIRPRVPNPKWTLVKSVLGWAVKVLLAAEALSLLHASMRAGRRGLPRWSSEEGEQRDREGSEEDDEESEEEEEVEGEERGRYSEAVEILIQYMRGKAAFAEVKAIPSGTDERGGTPLIDVPAP